MPNSTSGRGPGSRQVGAPRNITPWILGGAIALVVASVVLAGNFGRPPSPSELAAAESPRPTFLTTGSTPDGTAAGPGDPSPSVVPAASPDDPAATPAGGTDEPPGETSAPAAPTPEPIPAARLQRRLDDLRKSLQIPGVSVAILWDDGRQWLGTSGWADVAAKEPMTPDTAFALASVSKTFTAAVVLQLVEEGKLSLDAKVAKLLPQFGLDPKMTVRQLLDHTSGLPDYFLNAKIDRPLQAKPDATWTAEQTWKYVRKKHPDPGNLWIYSNANYLALGELVQEVTGRPLATEIRKRLLNPLDLADAWYQAVEKPRAPETVGYRVVAKAGGGVTFLPAAPASEVMPFRSVVTAAGGAGSMAATALDAARWMRAYTAGDVLSAKTRKLQVADVAATKALGATIPYGLGVQTVPVLGHRALGHSGRFLGFRNVVRYLPDDGITIAVLTNQGVRDPARIERALIKIVLPKPEPEASASPAASSGPDASATP